MPRRRHAALISPFQRLITSARDVPTATSMLRTSLTRQKAAVPPRPGLSLGITRTGHVDFGAVSPPHRPKNALRDRRDASPIVCMAKGDFAPLESVPEVAHRRNGVDGWEHLRQRAIGMAWRRETSLTYLTGHAATPHGWSAVVIAELTR